MKFFSSLLILIFQQQAVAAACCGGSSAMPSLITGDDKFQMTASISELSLVANVDANGTWKHLRTADETSSLKLDGAFLISDLWQLGIGAPLMSRHLGNESSNWNLGDISLSVGYEALPDWDYSKWRPHGIVFSQLTAPTGASVYDGNPEASINISGKGFWNAAFGVYLAKTWGNWDFSLTPEAHRSLNRKDQDGNNIKPGWGRSLSLACGWNKKDFRVGAGLSALTEDPIKTEGSISSPGAEQRVWTGLLSISYMWSPEISSTLAYANQTLFGDPSNAFLGQSLNFSLQQRWPR